MVVSTVGPLGTVLLAMLLLGEQPSASGWFGIVLTLGGGLLTGLGKAPTTTASPPLPGHGAEWRCAAPAPSLPGAAAR